MARLFALLIACLLSTASFVTPVQAADDYAAMLGYLGSTRLDGNALRGASGAIAVNMAAGDLNQQANLRAIAAGGGVSIGSLQLQRGNRSDRPRAASAEIGGQALAGGSGIASINQASGSANGQLNAVAVLLAAPGIRETTDDSLSTVVSASAERQHPGRDQASDNAIDPRSAAVAASSLQGYQGVLQLNQAAGSGNATGNQLLLSVPSTSR